MTIELLETILSAMEGEIAEMGFIVPQRLAAMQNSIEVRGNGFVSGEYAIITIIDERIAAHHRFNNYCVDKIDTLITDPSCFSKIYDFIKSAVGKASLMVCVDDSHPAWSWRRNNSWKW